MTENGTKMLNISNKKQIIAVIDDEFDLMCLWKDALSQFEGVDVIGFTDSVLALEHYKANKSHYMLILSNFRMPSMDGVKLLNNVKSMNPSVKTILISAFDVKDNIFQDCGCIDKFLSKPIQICDLISEVRRQIELTSPQDSK